jgi:selenide,water dikinase
MTLTALDEGASGLRSLASCGGCAAKADPSLVDLLVGAAVAQAARLRDPDVLVGLAEADDAAVYRLDADRALVATVDFFPPLVDDPGYYGAVAAANAVSDVYAMGGRVAMALVVSGFPDEVPDNVVATVTHAAAQVVASCGGQVVGGHSIRCREPVFGLAVLGFVHPDQAWRKSGARPGDVLVLSKSLGTGVLLSEGRPGGVETAVGSMRSTNQDAAAALAQAPGGPHAVTDVTGYGLAGHAAEVAQRSNTDLVLVSSALPLLHGARAAAAAGIRTSADASTRSAFAERVRVRPDVPEDLAVLAFDPQTSGGLLAAVRSSDVPFLLQRGFAVVGSVVAGAGTVDVVA